MRRVGVISSIFLAYPPPQPQPTPPPPTPGGPTYPPPPPSTRSTPPPPPLRSPPRKKMPMVLTMIGAILLIVGLILMVFMWPFIAGVGVYEDMDDLPKDPEEGQTYTFLGTIDKAHQEGDYTVMVIEFEDGKLGWVDEGEFNEGDSVLFNVKCEDKDEWDEADVGGAPDDDTDWDEWFAGRKQASEEELELYVEMMEDGQDESGMEIEVSKPPMIGGIIGVVLLIVGIVILILGLVLRSRSKRSAAPAPPPSPQPYQPAPPPPPLR